ncbi:hypothetical protein RhiJN_21985 [Ceratobasidium sp. AG-Ba]|nr:hypothetical protein RhiJN_21985 [Ceratobasidium sp. AG-Ba]
MQMLYSLFALFTILGDFLPTLPTAGDLVAIDPPVTWQATVSRVVTQCGSVTGAVVTAALQVPDSEDLVLYTAPVGSLVWRSTSPALHTWGRHALRFVDTRVSSTSATLSSIVRASIEAHDAMYRGGRSWYSGKGVTSACVFANLRARLPRPATLGLPAPPQRLALPAPPQGSAPVLPAPAPKIVSLPPAPAPLPWLIPDSAPNTFPVPLSLASCTPLLTWAVPENRDYRFLRRVHLSDSQVNNAITEQQILAVLLLVVLWTLLGDFISFGLDEGYVLYLLNGVGIHSTQHILEEDDIAEHDVEAGCPLDSHDDLYRAEPGELTRHIGTPAPYGPSQDKFDEVITTEPVPVEAPADVVEDEVTGDASSSCQLTPDSFAIRDAVGPTSPPTLDIGDSSEVEPAADAHPPEPAAPIQESAEDVLPALAPEPHPVVPALTSTVVPAPPPVVPALSAALSPKLELEPAVVPEADAGSVLPEPAYIDSPSPLPQAGPSEPAATLPASLDEPKVDQPTEAEAGEVEPKKRRTRGGRRGGGKSKKRHLQQQVENGGTEVARVESNGAEVAGAVEREPSDSRWFIRQRRQARK